MVPYLYSELYCQIWPHKDWFTVFEEPYAGLNAKLKNMLRFFSSFQEMTENMLFLRNIWSQSPHKGIVQENKKSARARLATSITATVRPRL